MFQSRRQHMNIINVLALKEISQPYRNLPESRAKGIKAQGSRVPSISAAHVAYAGEAKSAPSRAELVSGALCSQVLRCRPQQTCCSLSKSLSTHCITARSYSGKCPHIPIKPHAAKHFYFGLSLITVSFL